MMTKNLAQIWAEMLAALSASFEGRSWKIWLVSRSATRRFWRKSNVFL